ncbi:MAG: SpoIIE family protein phosphatase [Phycisphaerales bacterium]
MLRRLNPRNWPLTFRTAADLLVAALVPLAIGTWMASSRGMAALDGSAKQNLELLASVTATQLDQLMEDTTKFVEQVAADERVIEFCAAAPEARDPMRGAVQRRLALVPKANADFDSIFLIGVDGIGIASTNPANVGQDLRFREYWRAAAKDGTSYITSVLIGKTTGKPGIYYSVPVRQGETIVGVAVLKVSGTRVGEIVDNVRIGDEGRAAISDREGVILASPDKSLLYHSFGPLSREAIEKIDPKTSFSVPTIESAGIPGLMAPLTGAVGRGSADFTRLDSATGREAAWVVGYAPMRTQPWILSVTMPQAQFAAPLIALRRQQRLVVLLVAALAGAYAIVRARGITRPIVSLTGAAQRIADGDFTARAEVRSDDEIGRLGAAFNAMVPRLQEHLDLRQSLAVAMDVQQALLPSADPTPDGLDVAGRSRYCDETGGDYFDFIDVSKVAPGCTLIALGDVMGHGVASALLMASARAALRASIAERADLANLLTRVNRVLAADARHGRFMTMIVALIDMRHGTVRWASAGHDPIIRYDRTTGAFDELEGADLPLGVMATTEFEQFERSDLRSGQLLLLGTDGIWETRNAAGEMFGKDRLRAILGANAELTASEIAGVIDTQLATFRGLERIHDDITYVVVRVT